MKAHILIWSSEGLSSRILSLLPLSYFVLAYQYIIDIFILCFYFIHVYMYTSLR